MKLLITILASTALVPAVALAQTAPPAQPTGTAQQQPAQQQAAQSRPATASQLAGKEVVNARGEAVGRVERVVIGQGDQVHTVVRFNPTAGLGTEPRLVPANRLSMREDRIFLMGDTAQMRDLVVYRADLAGFREAEPNRQIALSSGPAGQQQADGSQILVQQAAPTVRVDQASPQVTVQQAQPTVTVRQPQPEIIVRQPQPTVTVDIPQPEIILRMPQPDVNVAMAQPQVQVNQPQPQVQVLRPQQQPQVQVERAPPQVTVQQAQGQPNIQMQANQEGPQVRYERAEPRIVVNAPQGQPQVRVERMGEGQQQQATAQQRPAQQATAQQQRQTSVYTEEQRRAVRERLNAGDVEATGAVTANVQTRPVAISELEDTNVYNARGEELGEVDRVIVTPQGRQFLVVGSGGFLGIGRDRVAFPIERFWQRGDRLVIRGVTEQDIEAMDDYRDQIDSFQRVGRNDRAELRVWQ